MGVGEDWVCFDVEKEYVGEEDEVIWPHRPEERHGEKTDARKDERQAEKGRPATTWFHQTREREMQELLCHMGLNAGQWKLRMRC